MTPNNHIETQKPFSPRLGTIASDSTNRYPTHLTSTYYFCLDFFLIPLLRYAYPRLHISTRELGGDPCPSPPFHEESEPPCMQAQISISHHYPPRLMSCPLFQSLSSLTPPPRPSTGHWPCSSGQAHHLDASSTPPSSTRSPLSFPDWPGPTHSLAQAPTKSQNPVLTEPATPIRQPPNNTEASTPHTSQRDQVSQLPAVVQSRAPNHPPYFSSNYYFYLTLPPALSTAILL